MLREVRGIAREVQGLLLRGREGNRLAHWLAKFTKVDGDNALWIRSVGMDYV